MASPGEAGRWFARWIGSASTATLDRGPRLEDHVTMGELAHVPAKHALGLDPRADSFAGKDMRRHKN